MTKKKPKKKPKKIGRPTKYTKILGKKICTRIANGESVKSISRDSKMPSTSMIYRWLLDEDKKEFRDIYNFSMDVRTEGLADELIEISDGDDQGEVQRDRLRVDTRKWIAAKLKPKKYGEKMDLTTDGKSLNISFDESFKEKDIDDAEE